MLLSNNWEERLLVIGLTQSTTKPFFGYYDYLATQLWLKELGGTTASDDIVHAQFSADGKSLFAIGSFYSAAFRPPAITSAIQFLILFKINLVTQTISQTIQLNNPYSNYGSVGSVVALDKRNNLLVAGAFPNFGTSPYLDNMFLVKFQPNLQDWACFYT